MSISLIENRQHRPYNSIGDAIKHFRKKNGLTQSQLGERVGVKQSTVCQYEKNMITPPIKVIKMLSRELGVSVTLLIEHKLRTLSDV